MEMSKLLIYGLFDPINKELRYIGKSSSGLIEPNIYLKPYYCKTEKNKRRHVCKWINSLSLKELKPEIFILEDYILTQNQLNEAEQFYIAYYKGIGCNLTNHTFGGEGLIGYKHTAETRKKLSIIGKSLTKEHSNKLQQAREKYFKTHPHPKWIVKRKSDLEALRLAGLKGTIVSTQKHSIKIQNQFGKVFPSINGAARELNLSSSEIYLNLKGKRKACKGFTFKRL